MSSYKVIKDRVQKFNYFVAIVGATLVFLTMFITTIDVVGRFFGFPFQGTMEISELALAVMVFLGWAYVQAEKGHIFIDIFFNILPKKLRNIMDVINPLFGIMLLGLVAWQSVAYTMDSKVSLMRTDNIGIPYWPFHFMIFIGAVTFCLQLVFDLIDAVKNLGGE
jgi:TRAP-type C4-dicarboxylate transport system permease small subunit